MCIVLIERAADGSEVVRDQYFHSLNVLASTKNLIPVSEIIEMVSWHDNIGDFILPPPAIVPPLPVTLASPTVLHLLSTMGGGIQSSREAPAILPLG